MFNTLRAAASSPPGTVVIGVVVVLGSIYFGNPLAALLGVVAGIGLLGLLIALHSGRGYVAQAIGLAVAMAAALVVLIGLAKLTNDLLTLVGVAVLAGIAACAKRQTAMAIGRDPLRWSVAVGAGVTVLVTVAEAVVE